MSSLAKFKFVTDPGTSDNPKFANPLSTAVIDIKNRLYPAAIDLNNIPILISAERGIDSVMKDVLSGGQPNPDECPCVRILTGQEQYAIKTVDFLTLDGQQAIHLYFIYYEVDLPHFEERRDDHIRRCMRFLQPGTNDANNNFGFEPNGNVWGFPVSGWRMTVDHETPLKFFG